ncbi:MAG: hypothetical protein ACE5ET_02440 [Gammaproteobacteria bacterium]
MSETFMILPAPDPQAPRLVRVPADYEQHEAYRHVTAVLAELQERTPDWSWEDLAQELEVHGFTCLDYILGPSLG